ncbi:MAG TPA: IS481 family transposase [Gaiellaceae bacterium]|nr:IS481 family transposase [Gaiellaceae bacterium]
MRFSFESRCRLVSFVLAGQSPQAAAAACGASRATGYRLWRRYLDGGWAALADRAPVPKRQPRRLPLELEQRILAAREVAQAGPLIVAAQLNLPPSTVWKVLRRYGVSRLPRPNRGPIVRYERARPGELLHVDIKRLGRFWTLGKRVLGSEVGNRSRHAGWQYLHLAIDDHSRLAYAELLPSESPADCVAFLRRALSWYAEHGVTIERVLSDNGNGYRSLAWRDACATLGVQRRYTRSRRPQTNGKAEALVKTLLREWAYRFAYPSSAHRARALPGYLRWYNQHRPHSSIGGRPPISRVSQVCGSHI